MTELINLLDEMPDAIKEMITAEGLAAIKGGECVALGMMDDDQPVGAIVCDPGFNGEAEILSLFVHPDKRRQGFGTELVYQAVIGLFSFEGMYGVSISFSERPGEGEGLRELLEYLEFTIEKSEDHGAFSFKLRDAATSNYLKGAGDDRVEAYSKTLSRVKNRISAAHESVRIFGVYGTIDEDISCIVNKGDQDEDDISCLIVGKEGEDLVIAWAQAAENSLDLINMLKFTVPAALKKYGPDQTVNVPYVNGTSRKIIEKIVGGKAESSETVWNAYLSLEWTEEEDSETEE